MITPSFIGNAESLLLNVDLLDEIEMFDAVVQEFPNSNCTS
jgi:hypothetical protein